MGCCVGNVLVGTILGWVFPILIGIRLVLDGYYGGWSVIGLLRLLVRVGIFLFIYFFWLIKCRSFLKLF